jgi:hypothetical protein
MTTDQAYRDLARDQFGRDGELEFDEDAKVSVSEDETGETGAYVAAWVWVALPDDRPEARAVA